MISSSDLGTGHMSVGNTTSVTSLVKLNISEGARGVHKNGVLSTEGFSKVV